MSGESTGIKAEFKQGYIVQEFGYDEDIDFQFRDSIQGITGENLEDEDYRGIADVVLAWWRSDDGDVEDLADYLMDGAASLESGSGSIFLVVPDRESPYQVAAADIDEAAKLAGQSVTTTFSLHSGWTAFHITARGF